MCIRDRFAELEQKVAGIETGEESLDAAYETAQERYDRLRQAYDGLLSEQRRLQNAVSEDRARLSGLSAARTPRDGAAALQKDYAAGIEASLAEKLSITTGWEKALAAVLGSLDTALVTADAESAARALDWLAEQDGGRAHLVYPEPGAPAAPVPPALPAEVDGECVFCAIVAGRAEQSLVAGTELALAFLDVQPAVTGHALVVPRRHVPALGDLTADEGAAVWELGRRVAAAARAAGLADGVNLFLADGAAAGQEVWHAHLHVLPLSLIHI